MSLARLTSRDGAFGGGKAASLGEMLRASLPVPGGFCVTTTAFCLWLEGSPRVASLIGRLDQLSSGNRSEIESIAAGLRQELGKLAVPPVVQEAIAREAARAGMGSEIAWAVRSSATAEDLPSASFAGQHDSILNVRGGEAMLVAVRQCWVSLFSERAVLYRSKNRIPNQAVGMAVVVQEMVPAEVSGVLFTADPLTGSPGRLVVEAVRGLGEALVSGKAAPERLVFDKESLQVLERAANPERPDGLGGPIDGEAQQTGTSQAPGTCLDHPLVHGLVQLGLAAERLFGRPQDIEWAAYGGRVFLLQSRPITALPAARAGEPEVWSNANIMEALPDVVTPMAWSLMEILFDEFLCPVVRRVGLDVERRRLVRLIAGRAYLNTTSSDDLVRQIAGPLQVDAIAAFGGLHGEMRPATGSSARPKVLPNLPTLWRLVKLSGWLLPGLVGQERLIERWGNRVFGDLARTPPASLTDEELAKYPTSLLRLAAGREGERTWAAAIWMAVAAVGGSAAVFQFAAKWLGDTDNSLANRLIAGAVGMNSAENGLELLRFAAWARQNARLKEALLEPVPFAVLEGRLVGVPKGNEFLERWRVFLERHGHQARGGMDIYQPRWSELPDFVLDMLRGYLKFDETSDPLATQARQRRERDALLADCRRRLRNPLKRWLFTFCVRAARRGLAQRENTKNDGVRLVALLRRVALEAGKRLTQRGLLRQPDDVFFLRLQELKPALCGSDPAFDVPAVVAARQTEHVRYRLLDPPPVVVGEYDPGAAVPATAAAPVRTFQGVAVSPGVATGRARVILQADAANTMQPGEILVAPYTDPGWTPCFLAAAAVVVDIGGLLSHGSVVAREYGLPAVVNVGLATRVIKTGQQVRVDGYRGTVTVLD